MKKTSDINNILRCLEIAEHNELIKYNDYLYENYYIYASNNINKETFNKSLIDMMVYVESINNFNDQYNLSENRVLKKELIRSAKDNVVTGIIEKLYIVINRINREKSEHGEYENMLIKDAYLHKIGVIEAEIRLFIKKINRGEIDYIIHLNSVLNKIFEIKRLERECNGKVAEKIEISEILELEKEILKGIEAYRENGTIRKYSIGKAVEEYEKEYLKYDNRKKSYKKLNDSLMLDDNDKEVIVRYLDVRNQKIKIDSIDKIIICAYMADKSNSYIKNAYGSRYLKYESEYIISGKKSDRENLKSTLIKIKSLLFLLRSPQIFMNEKLNLKAYKISLAICGTTGIGPSFIEPIKNLVLLSYVENKIADDIMRLRSNKKVKLFNNIEINYQEFIIALMFFVEDNKLINRCKELINMNMEHNGQGCLINYYQGAKYEIKVKGNTYINEFSY
jgi:hypothetical protein